MALPYFFLHTYQGEELIQMDEANSRHMIAVLRMEPGEEVLLTDGKGLILQASIVDAHKKKAMVRVVDRKNAEAPNGSVTIAISPVKNTSRFEWFLEKATELGISEIIPMICDRTEKENFRYDRMKGILISAMLQSQQAWLPLLHQPVGFGQLLRLEEINRIGQRFIAHCLPAQKQSLAQLVNITTPAQLVLIGPEGDFTKEEVDFALSYHFIPVSLGHTRLRAETAGMVAAAILKVGV